MKNILLILFTVSMSINLNAAPSAKGVKKGHVLLTVFLKHNQEKNIDEIKSILKKQKFFENFPPKDTSVVSWYVMMGIGQVVTLEVPAEKIRSVNLAVEKHGWKAFKTEFYPTYNLYPVIKENLKNKSKIQL